jgi:hypothetical protein
VFTITTSGDRVTRTLLEEPKKDDFLDKRTLEPSWLQFKSAMDENIESNPEASVADVYLDVVNKFGEAQEQLNEFMEESYEKALKEYETFGKLQLIFQRIPPEDYQDWGTQLYMLDADLKKFQDEQRKILGRELNRLEALSVNKELRDNYNKLALHVMETSLVQVEGAKSANDQPIDLENKEHRAKFQEWIIRIGAQARIIKLASEVQVPSADDVFSSGS